MTDFDIAVVSVSLPFRKTYMRLCTGNYTDSELVREAQKALKADLNLLGTGGLDVIERYVPQLPMGPLFFPAFDPPSQRSTVEEIARTIEGDSQSIELGQYSCLRLISRIESGDLSLLKQDLHLALLNDYVWSVYQARFVESMPVTRHYADADPAYIELRLNNMETRMKRTVEYYARRIKTHGGVDRLRLPPKARKKTNNLLHVDLDDWTL